MTELGFALARQIGKTVEYDELVGIIIGSAELEILDYTALPLNRAKQFVYTP